MRSTWVGIGLVAAAAVIGATSCGDNGEGSLTGTTAVQLTATNYVTIPPASSTLAPPVTSSGLQPEQEYIIEEGDLPVTIARKFSVPFPALMELNGWVLEGQFVVNFPPVGTPIRIPAGGSLPGESLPAASTPGSTIARTESTAASVTSVTAPVFTAAPTTTMTDCPTEDYTVVAGDYPLKVAEQFGVTVQQLNAVNGDTPGYRGFSVGIVIKIPTEEC